MKMIFRNAFLAILGSLTLSACNEGADTPAVSGGPVATAIADEPAGVCALLTRDEAATVLADNDGGSEQSDSAGALLKDVEFSHCRYLHVAESGFSWLDLLVYRASSDEGFEQIKIAEWAHEGSSRRLDIGDIGYLHDMSDQNEMVATASKGRTVFELKLNADDAAGKSEELIALATIVAEKI